MPKDVVRIKSHTFACGRRLRGALAAEVLTLHISRTSLVDYNQLFLDFRFVKLPH